MANSGSELAQDSLSRAGIHASETAWVGTEFDAVIDNNGSIASLYENLRNLVVVDSVAKVTYS